LPDEEPTDDTEIQQPDDEETEPPLTFLLDGKVLRISPATALRGVSVRVFDEKGHLVVDQRIPDDQPTDNYYVKLAKRQRYFLRLDMGSPILIDVPLQEVKQ